MPNYTMVNAGEAKRFTGSGEPGRRVVMVDGQPLRHRVQHSPDGFEWGYAGSGPADLARSILWEVLGQEPPPTVYQAFKAERIAKIQDNEWLIVETEVRQWLTKKWPNLARQGER